MDILYIFNYCIKRQWTYTQAVVWALNMSLKINFGLWYANFLSFQTKQRKINKKTFVILF